MNNELTEAIEMPKNGTRLTLIVLGIQFLLVFANLYLSNGYVSKITYEADIKNRVQKDERFNEELKDIAIQLKGINDHNMGDAGQDKRIDDLEHRMRDQERKR